MKKMILKTKDKIIFGALFMWMIMPILQTIRPIYEIFSLKETIFELMRVTGVIGIALAIFAIYDKIKKTENKKSLIKELVPIILFVIYMIWTLISSLMSPNKEKAFEGTLYRREGYFMYLNYAGYFLCAFLLDDKKLKRILLNAIVISSLYLIIISRICSDGLKYQNIFINNTIDHTVFAQFNHYGYYLMISFFSCLGLFITEKNKFLKLLYILIYSVIGYGLIYNDTFGCYLATIVVLILYTIFSIIKKRDRRCILSAMTIFVILSIITTKWNQNIAYKNIKEFVGDIKTIIYKIVDVPEKSEEQNEKKEDIEKKFEQVGTSRMLLWKSAIKFIKERPVIGYGPDNLGIKYIYEGINQDRPHNLIIYLSAVSGIPGMIIYVIAVGIIVVKGIIQMIKKDSDIKIYVIVITAYLISSMFGNSMYYTSPYFFVLLGCLMNSSIIKHYQ